MCISFNSVSLEQEQISSPQYFELTRFDCCSILRRVFDARNTHLVVNMSIMLLFVAPFLLNGMAKQFLNEQSKLL